MDYRGAETFIKDSDPKKAAEIICAVDGCEKSGWTSNFPPEPKTADIEMPKSQEPPESLKGITGKDFSRRINKQTRNCTKPFTIPDDLPDNAFTTDEDGTVHVYVKGKSSTLKGSTRKECKTSISKKEAIKISGDAPVRLYLDDSLPIGDSTWIDTSSVKHAADFMILGTPKAKKNQTLTIGGIWPEDESFKSFIWMPKGLVNFPRGNVKTRLEGAIWADAFKRTDVDATEDDFQLAVPEDMPQLIYQRLGKEFGIGQRDYVAQGVTSWRSYGRTPD